MKELCCLILLLWLLSGASLADEKLRLSQEDAKQLHAFLLTGELLDFGRRADSPGAYLMAVELMLDYPTADFDRVKALSLCRRARELAGGDPIFQSWAKRLELRASKTERGGLWCAAVSWKRGLRSTCPATMRRFGFREKL